MRRVLNRDLLAAGAIALAVHAGAYFALCGLPGPARETVARRARGPIAVVLVGMPTMEAVRQADHAFAEPAARAVARAPARADTKPTELPVERVAPGPSAPMNLDVRASLVPAAMPAERAPAVDLARADRPPAPLDIPPMPTAALLAAPGALPDASIAARATTPPRALRNDPPRYPRDARQRGDEGAVDLRIHVLPDGRCDEVHIERSSGSPSLDRAAVRAAKKWRFEPASDRGRAVAMWIEIQVEFNLQGTP